MSVVAEGLWGAGEGLGMEGVTGGEQYEAGVCTAMTVALLVSSELLSSDSSCRYNITLYQQSINTGKVIAGTVIAGLMPGHKVSKQADAQSPPSPPRRTSGTIAAREG
jgi:hypothetical protein